MRPASVLRTFLILVCSFSVALAGAGDPEKPVRGTSHTIRYTPTAGVTLSGTLTLVYAFDFWGTKATDDRSPEALFSNVLDPDPARVHRVEMRRSKGAYSAIIEIPNNASLLSYYVTDGRTIDDNGRKTFVRYLYGRDGHPVMGARFRNIDFMVIAGRTTAEQSAELAAELEEYPQNHMAYVPYWMLRFETVTTLDSLERLKPVFEQTLGLMSHVVSPDTVQNVRAGITFRYARRLGVLASQAYRTALREVEMAIESIPAGRRSVYLEGILAGIKEGRYDR